ncbi:MAG: GspE/PulE family protein [Candidatus Gracilibacteria bacterium]|jgi:type II secretory ATPase GspE/PulE/Tfp pilus assembly ATPase PilB-like protein
MSEKLTELQNAIVASDVPRMAASMISYAIELESSDIHVESAEYTIRVRFRVDGILRPIIEYPPSLHSALVSRIKIMSNLKIDETRIPQDGRTRITTKDGKDLDLRVSTLPTIYGEKIVMRIQNRSRKIPTLNELGIDDHNLAIIKNAISAPNGIMLTTGPTGSGKTTTLYACLNVLNTPAVNILTIEDPVEIQLDGLNQSQVHPAIGYDFAFGLRTGLRQDPDIIMVGEIRDKETIEVAVEASLTGHLVLSTIHTNSAASTITRLIDMEVATFLITATLNAIIAQRLVRKICPNCREEAVMVPELEQKIRRSIATMNPEERNRLGLADVNQPIKIFHGKGCDACGGTGYHGRVGLFEVMQLDNKLKDLILKKADEHEIETAAIAGGMKTLEHDGIEKILQGITTPEEVYTVARATEITATEKTEKQ